MNKKLKFLKAEQKEGKYKRCYFGIEIESTKDKVSMLGVDASDDDDIDVLDLEKEDYNFKIVDKEAVQHRFTVATLSNQNALNTARINFIRAKRNLSFCNSKMKQYFSEEVKK